MWKVYTFLMLPGVFLLQLNCEYICPNKLLAFSCIHIFKIFFFVQMNMNHKPGG